MEKSKLKEYLGIVMDMEKNILLREHLIAELAKKTKQLGIPHTFTKPVKPREWLPPADFQDNYEMYAESTSTSIGCLSATLLLPIFLIVCAVVETVNGGSRTGFKEFLVSLISAFLLSFALKKYIMYKKRLHRETVAQQKREEYEQKAQLKREQAETVWRESMRGYHEAVSTYQQNVAKDKKRVQLENEQRELLYQEIRELTQDQAESMQHLDQIYAEDVIFSKYRNLVAVASLYECICAGRCSSLEGHEGAYNIYETEVRLDRIVTQLDQVLAHLDTIRNNQFVLFTSIQEINQQCAQILQSVQDANQKSMRILEAASDVSDNIAFQIDSINSQANQISVQLQELQKTSALAAYHTERTQKELAYMNRMDYLSGRNDGVFFNHPPAQ